MHFASFFILPPLLEIFSPRTSFATQSDEKETKVSVCSSDEVERVVQRTEVNQDVSAQSYSGHLKGKSFEITKCVTVSSAHSFFNDCANQKKLFPFPTVFLFIFR